MATTLGTLRTEVRTEVNEPTASFWADAELLVYLIAGCKDLWRAVKDTLQDHFFTVSTAVTMEASTATLANVPTDIAEIRLIEPLDLNAYPSLVFQPRAYNHADFQNARASSAVDARSAGVIYYAITGAGGPVGAPTIYVAPLISAQLALRVMYVPNLGALTADSNNPIPGESDNAVKAWCKAYALGRQNPDGTIQPDAAWMTVYENEKDKILTAVTPRQTQETQVAEALFEGHW
jgi:hypothetical protein